MGHHGILRGLEGSSFAGQSRASEKSVRLVENCARLRVRGGIEVEERTGPCHHYRADVYEAWK
jgi:hypothetical protein